ncbi:MAG: amidohydrolase family protein, partial [Bauldia sp.]
INDRNGFTRLLEGSRRAVAGLAGATIGVAPHSLRAATPEELGFVTALLPDAPVHMHIAEQMKEVDDSLAWSGQRPVEWLLDHAAVDRRWCLIHATHMTEAETERLARTGAVAGLCPLTEASLGDGTFNGPEWTGAGGAWGVGTDSNILVGLAAELRQLEYAQRLRQRLRNVLADREGASTGRSLFDAALAGGAQALGVAAPAIAAGKPADIVGLDASHPSIAYRHGDAILDGWIFAADRGAVASVWIGGKEAVREGRHIARDAIETRFKTTLARLLAL